MELQLSVTLILTKLKSFSHASQAIAPVQRIYVLHGLLVG